MTEGDYRDALKIFRPGYRHGSHVRLGLCRPLSNAYSAPLWHLPARCRRAAEGEGGGEKALELDPDLAEAHANLGGFPQMSHEWDWQSAERSFRRAVELKPNDAQVIRFGYGYLLVVLRPVRRGRDPVEPCQATGSAVDAHRGPGPWLLLDDGRNYREAIAALRRTVAGDSSFVGAPFQLSAVYLAKGELGPAQARLSVLRSLMGDHPDVLGRLGNLYAVSGQREKAHAIADTLKGRYHKGAADEAYALAVVHTALGETERALDWLETAYAERSTWMNLARVHPELDPLRSQPRFRALLEKLKLD